MPTRSVQLTEHLDRLVETGVRSGRFSDASEVVREGLRLLEQKESEDQARIAWLRNATSEAFAALDRGEGIVLSSAEDVGALVNGALDEMRSSHNAVHD